MTVSYGDDDPIAAFATIPGNSALTLIRCSGKGSIELAASVFSSPKKLINTDGNRIAHGWITSASEKIDEVLISVFRCPASYTGEDSLDISCHGGFSAGHAVLKTLKAAGFRDALPGEFTFRAFMNGKLDLTRSESVMEIVSAKTDTGRRHAVQRLSGLLETEIYDIKKMLIEVLAGAEIFLDYSEDEIEADTDETAGRLPNRELAGEALVKLEKLASSWQREKIYQEGIFAVIAGRPNAGKSSLFNLLLREDRSIVTGIPGTTRDWIEAWVSIGGIPVRLADTAGLQVSLDPVEKLGIQRSRELLYDADLILYLIDGTVGLHDEDRDFITSYKQPQKPFILLWNKADLEPMLPFKPGTLNEANGRSFQSTEYSPISISAKTGEGIQELSEAIAAAIQLQSDRAPDDANTSQNAALGTARQKVLVDSACTAVKEAILLADRQEPLDLIAPLLRDAVNSLGEITGEVSTADILEEMFSRFCVGK